MKVLIVNCSAQHYNRASYKMADYYAAHSHDVTRVDGDPGLWSYGYDLVCLSVIFSWHAPMAVNIANRVKSHADVQIGGPGITAMRKWLIEQTGIEPFVGVQNDYEQQRGNYRMTFASRGCPVGCYFCIVPKLEGTEFTLYWDFQPAPVLMDNNLSALPIDFQEHIIRRYHDEGMILKDANSGFEPRTFTEDTYQRWRGIMRSNPWRFAYDTMSESNEVEQMMKILQYVPKSQKRVYVLIGNEPFDGCYTRAERVIAWGGEPYVQPLLPLNALRRDQFKIAFDWTPQRLKDFARYYNKWLWRSFPLKEYKPRQNQPNPFGVL